MDNKIQGSVIKQVGNINRAIPVKPQVQEKKININKWELFNGQYLISYTAKWCSPCQRIKPVLLELTKTRKHLGSKEVGRTKRPEHVKFIPWFDIVDKDEKIVKSLQSSKEEDLKSFLNIVTYSYEDF